VAKIDIAPERQAQVFGALGDPLRVRFLRELVDHGEQTGTAVAERLGISLALLCHHSNVLLAAGLVEKRKQGQTTYYRANRSMLKACVRGL
jgi:DNA-binding transcriptional ArsR family regulator